MSTEHQQYSLDNQRFAIQAYADAHGFAVVHTYSDESRSGVVLKCRKGLRQLLKDVMSGTSAYKAILVYDVSRWGRFQDADEAAHYEFLCKSAGVPVHYCAETFVNNRALPNMLMKAVKRTMAGEFRRELGVRILAGLKCLAALGFKQRGCPGYGLRRLLVSADGQRKFELAPGERKSIATDRVILVPGPAEEVETVKNIYHLFLEKKRTLYRIARELNRDGTKCIGQSRWDYVAVHHILSRPKYAGCNVFGRTSQRLGAPPISVSASEWVLAPNAFNPLIDSATFQKVQQLLSRRTINKSNDELLAALRSLLQKEGRLSLRIIKNSPDTPSPSAYRGRFGSIRHAYEFIGYGDRKDFGPIDLRRRTQAFRAALMNKLQAAFPTEISIEQRGGRWRSYLRLRDSEKARQLLAPTRAC